MSQQNITAHLKTLQIWWIHQGKSQRLRQNYQDIYN